MNPYEQSYTGITSSQPSQEVPVMAAQVEPQLYVTNDLERDDLSLLENGYVLIGYSAFNSGTVDSKLAIKQAKKVGATLVLIQSQYTHTVTGVIPYTVQNPSQTVTTHNSGRIYGSSGYERYSGTSTTTVPGDYTTYQIPYSEDRYAYAATFWAKVERCGVGLWFNDLTDELRRTIGSNRGVVVTAVIKGSPAFNADIMRGDIITRINDEIVADRQSFSAALGRYAGKEIVLETYRNGVKRMVSLRLDS
jgi:membrane-associated protease RseP (regulator of RpoE activity)